MSSRTQKIKKLGELELALRRREVPAIPARGDLEGELLLIDKELRELVVAYEQYFIGSSKFEPAKERQIVTLRLRRLANVFISQTDLRFRLQTLASRLQSYAGYWDRVLRQIEEGRYVRQRPSRPEGLQTSPGERPPQLAPNLPIAHIYRQLAEAFAQCGMAPPAETQVATFLAKQFDTIRDRLGDRPVDLTVVVEDGKPKIRARPRG